MSRFRPGDRMVVTAAQPVMILIHWRAPLTSGVHATMPVGTVLTVTHTGPSGFGACPEDYERLQHLLVPSEDLALEEYDGYSISVADSDVGSWLEVAGD